MEVDGTESPSLFFQTSEKRLVRVLGSSNSISLSKNGILYWMNMRASENWRTGLRK
jgi:hypothetical protein